MAKIESVQGPSGDDFIQAEKAEAMEKAQLDEVFADLVQVEEKTLSEHELSAISTTRNKNKDERDTSLKPRVKRAEQVEKPQEAEEAQETGTDDPEISLHQLKALKEAIEKGGDPLAAGRELFEGDDFLLDKALSMVANQIADPALKEKIAKARTELNQEKVRAGQNTLAETRDSKYAAIGSPQQLREMYHNRVHTNPQEALPAALALLAKYGDNFELTRLELSYLLESFRKDMNALGPSVDPGLLKRLVDEIGSVQSVIGAYSFFFDRKDLLAKQFAAKGLPLPPQLTFHNMTEAFLKIVQNRYPSTESIVAIADSLLHSPGAA